MYAFLYFHLSRSSEAQGEAKASEESISKYHAITWGFKLQSFPNSSTNLFPLHFQVNHLSKCLNEKRKGGKMTRRKNFKEDHPI